MTTHLTHTPVRQILALPGSLRRNSYNRNLLQAAARCANAGTHIDIHASLAEVPLFNEDLESSAHEGRDAVHRLRAAIRAADGVLIATPEYNQSMPGVLKNVIDWLSRPAPDEVLAGKPVAITGVTTGRWGTRLAQAALRHTLTASGALVMPSPMLFVANAQALFDADGHLHDAAMTASLCSFVDAFTQWIEQTGTRTVRNAA